MQNLFAQNTNTRSPPQLAGDMATSQRNDIIDKVQKY